MKREDIIVLGARAYSYEQLPLSDWSAKNPNKVLATLHIASGHRVHFFHGEESDECTAPLTRGADAVLDAIQMKESLEFDWAKEAYALLWPTDPYGVLHYTPDNRDHPDPYMQGWHWRGYDCQLESVAAIAGGCDKRDIVRVVRMADNALLQGDGTWAIARVEEIFDVPRSFWQDAK